MATYNREDLDKMNDEGGRVLLVQAARPLGFSLRKQDHVGMSPAEIIEFILSQQDGDEKKGAKKKTTKKNAAPPTKPEVGETIKADGSKSNGKDKSKSKKNKDKGVSVEGTDSNLEVLFGVINEQQELIKAQSTQLEESHQVLEGMAETLENVEALIADNHIQVNNGMFLLGMLLDGTGGLIADGFPFDQFIDPEPEEDGDED
jgi:hypothetical protein